jgi:hypothetical protein
VKEFVTNKEIEIYQCILEYYNKSRDDITETHDSLFVRIENIIETKADVGHTHTITNITNLQTELNNKLNTSGGIISGNLQINGDVNFGSNTQRRNFTTFSNSVQINSPNTYIGTNDRTDDTILNFMGDQRPWHRILSSSVVGTGTEYLNIETSWNHPINFIQHSANFTGTQRTLTLLDNSGNTSIPGNLTVSGNITNTNLTNQLNGKTNTNHAHTIANVTNLQTELNNKLNTSGGTIT